MRNTTQAQKAATRPARRPGWSSLLLGISVGILVHIGAFKGIDALAQFPVDLTLLFTLIVLALALATLTQPKLQSRGHMWPLLALWALFLLGVPFVGTQPYALTKVLFLFTLCACLAWVSAAAVSRTEFLGGVLWSQVTAGVVMALLLAALGGHSSTGSRLLLEGSNSIGAARVVGAAVVVLMALAFTSRRRLIIHGLIVGLLLSILIGIGSRGPVLFALVALLATASFARWSGIQRFARLVGSIALASALIYVVLVEAPSRSNVERLLLPFTEDVTGDSSIAVRIQLIRASLSLIAKAPFGVGWGNFANAARANGLPVSVSQPYPHNVLLEVAVEAGVVPLIALFAVTVIALRSLHRLSSTPHGTAAFALAIYFVGNSLVSGDITSNRAMWCFIGIGVGYWARDQLAKTSSTPDGTHRLNKFAL